MLLKQKVTDDNLSKNSIRKFLGQRRRATQIQTKDPTDQSSGLSFRNSLSKSSLADDGQKIGWAFFKEVAAVLFMGLQEGKRRTLQSENALLKHTSYWPRVKLDCSYPSKTEHHKSHLQ